MRPVIASTRCPRCGEAHHFRSSFEKQRRCTCRKVIRNPSWPQPAGRTPELAIEPAQIQPGGHVPLEERMRVLLETATEHAGAPSPATITIHALRLLPELAWTHLRLDGQHVKYVVHAREGRDGWVACFNPAHVKRGLLCLSPDPDQPEAKPIRDLSLALRFGHVTTFKTPPGGPFRY